MNRHDTLKVLRILILRDLVRHLVDYDAYSAFIGLFLDGFLRDRHGADDEEMFDMCLETIVQ